MWNPKPWPDWRNPQNGNEDFSLDFQEWIEHLLLGLPWRCSKRIGTIFSIGNWRIFCWLSKHCQFVPWPPGLFAPKLFWLWLIVTPKYHNSKYTNFSFFIEFTKLMLSTSKNKELIRYISFKNYLYSLLMKLLHCVSL